MQTRNNVHTIRLFDLLGYFTLETKMLTLKQDSLSKTECKAISRFGYFDEDSLSYKLPAVLIAQFSRSATQFFLRVIKN